MLLSVRSFARANCSERQCRDQGPHKRISTVNMVHSIIVRTNEEGHCSVEGVSVHGLAVVHPPNRSKQQQRQRITTQHQSCLAASVRAITMKQ